MTDTENIDLTEAISPGSTDPSVEPRQQRIRGLTGSELEGFDRTYVQRKLSFFNKIALGKIIARLANAATDDGDTELLSRLGAMYQRDEDNNVIVDENGFPVRDMRGVMLAITPKIIELVPDQLAELYMLALGVPDHEKPIVREILQQPHGDDGTGGLSDEDGIAILETFIAQNKKAIEDLFFEHLARVVRMFSKTETNSQTEGSSARSKRTRRSTRKE